MIPVITSEPSVEPVTLSDLKDHVRVDFDDEDGLLEGLIVSARRHVERHLGRSLITRTLELRLERFPSDRLQLPSPPFQSLTSIAYTDAEGAGVTMDAADYAVLEVGDAAVVRPVSGFWPTVSRFGGVSVTWIAGYGDTAADVPADIAEAVKLLAAHHYAHREATFYGENGMRRLPFGVADLLEPYRERWFG